MRTHWFFDLDGTLARTGEDIISAWKVALTALGRDISNFDQHFRIGPTFEKVLYEMYSDATPELLSDLLTEFKPLYDYGGFPNTVPYPGVPEMLNALKAKGAKIYIITNKRHIPTQRLARKFGWDSLFDGIWSFDSFATPYKKPELLSKLLGKLNISAADAVMVGDTKGDIDSGKMNSTATVGVAWGYGTADELASADIVLNSTGEFIEKVSHL